MTGRPCGQTGGAVYKQVVARFPPAQPMDAGRQLDCGQSVGVGLMNERLFQKKITNLFKILHP